MPSYTLYYFNGRGRAEILRMIFNAADVKFTDKRFDFTEWDQIKKDMPTFSVPVLESDDKEKIPETMAIARYLAREHGFYGKDTMEMFRIDYICDCLYEIMHDYMRLFHEKNGRFRSEEKSKSNMVEELQLSFEETSHRILPFLEKTLEMKNDGKQFFMGDQMTLCDMMLFCFLENPMIEDQAMFQYYPKLMALYKRVAAHPKISAYLKKRPITKW